MIAQVAAYTAPLATELAALDVLLRVQVALFRSRSHQPAADEAGHGLFVSDAEVDGLLATRAATPEPPATALLRRRLLERRAALLAGAMRSQGSDSLSRLGRRFGLGPEAVQAVLICLAPELDPKYDRIYAYLQDDITRRHPSVALVLELIWGNRPERWRGRAMLAETAPLLQTGLLRALEDPHSPSGSSDLARMLAVEPRVVAFLLDDQRLDHRLAGVATLLSPTGAETAPRELAPGLRALIAAGDDDRVGPLLFLAGPPQADHRELALALCAQLRRDLLCVDLRQLVAEEADDLLRRAFREGVLQQAALLFEGGDSMAGSEPASLRARLALLRLHAELGDLTMVAGTSPWPILDAGPSGMVTVSVPLPDEAERAELWATALGEHGRAYAPGLARQFRLGARQIRAAVTTAARMAALAGRPEAPAYADTCAAARAQSAHALDGLAQRVELRAGWSDLVLPADQLAELREICAHARHEEHVFDTWGFGTRPGYRRSLGTLFAGPPGTGKTLAAAVVARELGLELFQIDLSQVMSKYIGETEKQLRQLFQAAATGRSVLFFDEADALFARRTAVSDAHDRYANIETGFLLQQLESYEGVVILASNLRENLDEAFIRRLRFVIEFSFPGADERAVIWRAHLPPQAPLAADLDLDLLARQLPISGGEIRNIALRAAFLAAEEGGPIAVGHILQAARREFLKTGRLWDDLAHGGAR